jgi:hypothetical protein
MGSQMVVDTTWGSVLGHTFDKDQMRIAYWIDQIAGKTISVSTTKTELGGTQVYGTSADYLLPTAARCIVAVRPKAYLITPTIVQSMLATLKVESSDLGMKDYEVFANPLDSFLTGSVTTMLQDASAWYPLMQPCNGGEKVQFYGTPQVANTVAPVMACDVLLSDTWPEGFTGQGWAAGYGPVQAKVAGINYGGGPTATGTTAGTVATDAGVTISGPKKRLIGLYGIAVEITPTTVNPIAGQFTVNASELALNPQRWNAEPVGPILGAATIPALAHISKVAPLNLALRAPSTPKGTFTNDIVLGAAGKFEVGYMYIDNP